MNNYFYIVKQTRVFAVYKIAGITMIHIGHSTQRHAKRLNHFHFSCLRKLLKIRWQDKIPDTGVLKKAGMQSMHTVLKLAQLRWTGHVIRMRDFEGKRFQGGQKKRYKDCLNDFDIPFGSWEQTA